VKAIGVLILAVLAWPAIDDQAADASKKDVEKLQGDWVAVAYTIDGTSLPDDDVQAFFRTIKGNEYAVSRYRKVIGRGTFKLDATKSPKTLDAIPANAPAGGKPILGIYSIEGDRLKFCVAAPGKDRPTEFSAKEGSGHTLTEWEREKR
jgi:uncharacterized protein (TIGR03067 family)